MNSGIIIAIVLAVIVFLLIIYNIHLKKMIETKEKTNERINSMISLQDYFMDTVGKETSSENKIKVINDILLEKFNIKYSTIVVFDGAEYKIKATNVDERLWDMMKNLHTDELFKESVTTATPQSITVKDPTEKLSYQRAEMARAKSAMFFPLYMDNVYIGYWIIESGEINAFKNIDNSILNKIKDNILTVLKMITYQNTVENIYRTDKTTGLYSAEYLYGKGKTLINRFDKSTICMFNITNIDEINKKYGREIGTNIIINIANAVKTNISSEYIFVRYMGPKFAIVYSGADIEFSEEFSNTIKESIEKIQLNLKNKKKNVTISPKTNFVLATYYKGTGIEEVTKRLEEYLDDADKEENTINSI